MSTAIILAGGEALRMKPEVSFNKALLQIGRKTLLSYQIEWLHKHGFESFIVATDENTYNRYLEKDKRFIKGKMIDFSLERKKLGTSGAILNACEYTSAKKLYVMNVDDILLNFNPKDLYKALTRGGIIALSKPRIGFGLVRMRNNLITRFQEKPTIKYWVSVGHYVFKRNVIKNYFLSEGDLERKVLPKLAKEKLLEGYKIKTPWNTINTYKDYLTVLKALGY